MNSPTQQYKTPPHSPSNYKSLGFVFMFLVSCLQPNQNKIIFSETTDNLDPRIKKDMIKTLESIQHENDIYIADNEFNIGNNLEGILGAKKSEERSGAITDTIHINTNLINKVLSNDIHNQVPLMTRHEATHFGAGKDILPIKTQIETTKSIYTMSHFIGLVGIGTKIDQSGNETPYKMYFISEGITQLIAICDDRKKEPKDISLADIYEADHPLYASESMIMLIGLLDNNITTQQIKEKYRQGDILRFAKFITPGSQNALQDLIAYQENIEENNRHSSKPIQKKLFSTYISNQKISDITNKAMLVKIIFTTY